MCPFTTPLGRSLTKCLSELELAASGTFSVGFYSKLIKILFLSSFLSIIIIKLNLLSRRLSYGVLLVSMFGAL